MVACAACGHVMKIPPQYADTPGRCGRCGATVNDRVLIPAIDLSDLGPPSPKKKTSAAVQNSETFSTTVRRALLAGLAGALVGGGCRRRFLYYSSHGGAGHHAGHSFRKRQHGARARFHDMFAVFLCQAFELGTVQGGRGWNAQLCRDRLRHVSLGSPFGCPAGHRFVCPNRDGRHGGRGRGVDHGGQIEQRRLTVCRRPRPPSCSNS